MPLVQTGLRDTVPVPRSDRRLLRLHRRRGEVAVEVVPCNLDVISCELADLQ